MIFRISSSHTTNCDKLKWSLLTVSSKVQYQRGADTTNPAGPSSDVDAGANIGALHLTPKLIITFFTLRHLLTPSGRDIISHTHFLLFGCHDPMVTRNTENDEKTVGKLPGDWFSHRFHSFLVSPSLATKVESLWGRVRDEWTRLPCLIHRALKEGDHFLRAQRPTRKSVQSMRSQSWFKEEMFLLGLRPLRPSATITI